MPYLNRGASALYYELHGEPIVDAPTKPVLILLHGVGGNHASWYHQIVAWRDSATILVVDARGFGNSSDAEQLGRAAFADDLLALVDALGLRQCVLIAQSMGGGAATQFTVAHRERVGALVLADTMVGLQLPEDMAQRMAPVIERANGLTQLARVLGPTFLAREPVKAYLYTALASFNDTNVRTLRGEQPLVTPRTLADTGVPILYVAGVEDVLFPASEIAALAAMTPGAAYLEITAAGHSAYFEQPDVFNAHVMQWLRGVIPQA
jgi:pimeloyl-ACP methyl ester carboxylesterase